MGRGPGRKVVMMPSISAGEICVGVLEIGAAGSLLCLYLIEKTLDEDVDADSDGIIGSASGRELDNLVIQLRMQGLPFGKSVGMLPSGAAGGFQTAPLLLPKGTCVQFAPAFLAHHCVTADCGKNSLSQNEDLSSATYLKPTFQMTSTDDAGHSVAEIFVGPAQMVSLLSNSIPEQQEKVKDAKATNWFKSTGPCISRFMGSVAPEKDSDVKLYDQRSQVVNVFADKKEPTSNHDGGIKKLLTELGLLLIGGGFTVTICISIRVFVCRRSLRGVVQQQQMTVFPDTINDIATTMYITGLQGSHALSQAPALQIQAPPPQLQAPTMQLPAPQPVPQNHQARNPIAQIASTYSCYLINKLLGRN